jgi:NADH-quinone oxidoreductase subunit G
MSLASSWKLAPLQPLRNQDFPLSAKKRGIERQDEKMPTLTINGKEITVEKGTTVIQAAEKLGFEVPRYCYHPGLSVAGNCRMCLVEIEKFPKLQISCHIQAADGMVVKTETDVVKKTRQHVLEFLLVNHPLDCPVCDQAGECWLQDYYMKHGLYDSRLNENKVKKSKAVPLGPTIMLDSERCILCSHCVRFTDEISKTSEIGIFNRGDHAEVGVYPGRELNNNYSGNVADICPVGALTDRDFRFKCRVWYLKSSPSVCPGCSMGCNIDIHYQTERSHIAGGDRVMRLKPRENPEVNKWWMCDEGRYAYQSIDHGRIPAPAVNGAGNDGPEGWDGALDKAAALLREVPKNEWAVLASPQLTNEELFLIRKIFSEGLGLSVYAVSGRRDGASDDFLLQADKNPNTRGAFELGLAVPATGANEIAKLAANGRIRGIYLFGQDLFEALDPAAAENLLSACRAVIFQGPNASRTADRAHVVLASAAYAEKDGTFTNFQRRVQRIFKAFEPKEESRPDWKILQDLASRLGLSVSYRGPKEIFDALAAETRPFNGLDYARIGKKGAVLA